MTGRLSGVLSGGNSESAVAVKVSWSLPSDEVGRGIRAEPWQEPWAGTPPRWLPAPFIPLPGTVRITSLHSAYKASPFTPPAPAGCEDRDPLSNAAHEPSSLALRCENLLFWTDESFKMGAVVCGGQGQMKGIGTVTGRSVSREEAGETDTKCQDSVTVVACWFPVGAHTLCKQGHHMD